MRIWLFVSILLLAFVQAEIPTTADLSSIDSVTVDSTVSTVDSTTAAPTTTVAPTTTTVAPTTTTVAPTTTTVATTTSTVAPTTVAPTTVAPTTSPTNDDDDGRSVCRTDASLYCADAMAMGRSALCECMRKHVDQLSPACATFVQNKIAEYQAGKGACRSDIATFCPNQEGKSAIRECMKSHFRELSSGCRDYIIQKKTKNLSSNACDSDATTLCSSVQGFSATLTCLKANITSVSQDCRWFLWMNPTHGSWGRHHGSSDRHHGSSDRHHGGDRHMKHEEKRTRRENAMLEQTCGEELQAFCANKETLHDRKDCLATNYATLSAPCKEQLISSSSGSSSHFGHMGKKILIGLGIFFAIIFVCVLKKRCKHRRRMWMELQQRRSQEPRYVAVPTQGVSPFAQVVQAQLAPAPTAPQQQQQQQPQQHIYSQGVVYAASPYTGGIPISAVPVAYNPHAMSNA